MTFHQPEQSGPVDSPPLASARDADTDRIQRRAIPAFQAPQRILQRKE